MITNKLINDLFSYLSHFYTTSSFCMPCYLVLYQHQRLSCNIWLFANSSACFVLALMAFSTIVFNFSSAAVSYFLSTLMALSTIIFNCLSTTISSIRLFFFISDHFTRSIGYPKSSLNHPFGPRLSKLSYLYRTN